MSKHKAHRGQFGYFYRGYYIERCPDNQWNIYDLPPRSVGFSELEIALALTPVDEGFRSLESAKLEIDSYLEGV